MPGQCTSVTETAVAPPSASAASFGRVRHHHQGDAGEDSKEREEASHGRVGKEREKKRERERGP